MNTSQIDLALRNDPAVGPYFAGVFPCDRLPSSRKLTFPCALVANTDPSTESGEHWVAFHFDRQGNAEYFDSYGIAPVNCQLFNFFQSHGRNHKINTTQLQGMTSTVCGHWCIAYLTKRARGQSMEEIVQSFTVGKKPGTMDAKVGALVSQGFEIAKLNNRIRRQIGSGGSKRKIQQKCKPRTCQRRHRNMR